MSTTIGNDIIEIKRIKDIMDRYGSHFLNRIFTAKEQNYCAMKPQCFAGRYAAKEAIVKALGTGIGALISWHDMEILNNESGKPFVFFSEKVKENFNNFNIDISISHCRKYASAVAIVFKEQ